MHNPFSSIFALNAKFSNSVSCLDYTEYTIFRKIPPNNNSKVATIDITDLSFTKEQDDELAKKMNVPFERSVAA